MKSGVLTLQAGKRAAVKYCGGCNPRIDRENPARALARAGALLVYPGRDAEDKADFILIINGCETGCVSPEEYPGYRHTLVVRGESLNGRHCPESDLPEQVLDAWLKTRGD